MIGDAVFAQESLTLQPGDRLYFHTDGVTEALNADEEEFGHARLLEEIARWRDRPLRAGLDLVAATVRGWCGGSLKDGVSLPAVERIEGASYPSNPELEPLAKPQVADKSTSSARPCGAASASASSTIPNAPLPGRQAT